MDLSLYGFQTLFKVYNVHPLFVHFPVALLPTTLLLFGLEPGLFLAARICLYLALCGVVAAVITGLLGAPDIPHDPAIKHIIDTHKTTGFIILGLTAFMTLWSFWQRDQRPKGAWGFLVILAITAYFAVQNGDLGSRMVFLQGAGVKPAAAIVQAKGAAAQSSAQGGSSSPGSSSSGKSGHSSQSK